MSNYIFVDCEARGTSPVNGVMTEFCAVKYDTKETFYGRLFEATPDPENPAISIVGERVADDLEVAQKFLAWLEGVGGKSRPIFVSDNVAYDWQWISGMFDRAGLQNPFGHSGRRISDFYAGVVNNFSNTQEWKRWRKTVHDHNPVNDAMGNVEAFEKILALAKQQKNSPKPQANKTIGEITNVNFDSGWTASQSGECCDKCAMRDEHFDGRADALKAISACRNPFQLKETCQCHIPHRKGYKAGFNEATKAIEELIAEAYKKGYVDCGINKLIEEDK